MTFADTNFDALDMKTAFGVAARSLDVALNQKQILAASIFVRNGSDVYSENLGLAQSDHAAFLLGSITKPIVIAALMSLHDEGLFQLEDPVTKYLPEFTEGNYRSVQVVHLLTHTCGLPDQLPNNAELRAQHAPLSAFVESCRSLAFHFQPGTKYEYSSMGILLASEIAQRISGLPIHKLVAQRVFVPLGMHDSALGLGDISESNRMPCQVEFGAPEAGGGEESTKDWNWNSQIGRAHV